MLTIVFTGIVAPGLMMAAEPPEKPILRALAGQAADRDGKVTVNSLASYVEQTLPKITYKKWGYEQIPQKSLQGWISRWC